MADPIEHTVRAAAQRLAAHYGPSLPAEGEAALHPRGTPPRAERYADPISVASLIVSVAALAWTIYQDLRTTIANRRTPRLRVESPASRRCTVGVLWDRVRVAEVISLLHRPVYTYSQVDRLLGLTSGTARRWINGYRRGRRTYEPIIRPQSRNTTWVTWGEYVEARLLANWRDLDRLPILKLRRLDE